VRGCGGGGGKWGREEEKKLKEKKMGQAKNGDEPGTNITLNDLAREKTMSTNPSRGHVEHVNPNKKTGDSKQRSARGEPSVKGKRGSGGVGDKPVLFLIGVGKSRISGRHGRGKKKDTPRSFTRLLAKRNRACRELTKKSVHGGSRQRGERGLVVPKMQFEETEKGVTRMFCLKKGRRGDFVFFQSTG